MCYPEDLLNILVTIIDFTETFQEKSFLLCRRVPKKDRKWKSVKKLSFAVRNRFHTTSQLIIMVMTLTHLPSNCFSLLSCSIQPRPVFSCLVPCRTEKQETSGPHILTSLKLGQTASGKIHKMPIR